MRAVPCPSRAARGAGGGLAWIVFDVALVGTTLVVASLVAAKAVEFGSTAGRWVLRYVGSLDLRLGVIAILGAVAVVVLHEVGRRWVDSRPVLVVAATLLAGIGLQLAIHGLYPWALGDLVVSDVATGFHGAAARFGPLEVLTDFDRVARQLPLHGRVNMPGKVLLFHALRAVTTDPAGEAILIVALSSLAGVFLYAIGAWAFDDRALAFDALLLWLVVPAKIALYPLLNVVSPLPAVMAVWCMVRFLAGRRVAWAGAAGVLTYVTVLFDPLALWLGVVFAPLLAHAVVVRGVRVREVMVLLGVAATSLAASHALVRVGTGFDVVARLAEMVGIVRDFNVRWMRPREVWVVANLREVALAVGPAVSVTVAIAGAAAVWGSLAALRDGAGAALRRAIEPGPAIAIMTLAVLAVLDGLCLNRGEVARLWLFLFLPAQLAAAWWTAARPASRRLLVACTVAYAALTVATVGYCTP